VSTTTHPSDPFSNEARIARINMPRADEAAADAGLVNEGRCWIIEGYRGHIPSPYITEYPGTEEHRYLVRHIDDHPDDPQSAHVWPKSALSEVY